MHILCTDLGLYAQRWKMLKLKLEKVLEIILKIQQLFKTD